MLFLYRRCWSRLDNVEQEKAPKRWAGLADEVDERASRKGRVQAIYLLAPALSLGERRYAIDGWFRSVTSTFSVPAPRLSLRPRITLLIEEQRPWTNFITATAGFA